MLDLSIHALIVFVHVLAGVALLGSSLHAPLLLKTVREARSLSEVRAAVQLERRATRWNPAAAFVLLGSGIYLGSSGWWTQAWFYVAIVAWVANTLLSVLVIGRASTMVARAALHGGDTPVSEEIERTRWSLSWSLASALMLANDVAILYVMFNKPAWAGSVGVLAGASLIAAGLCMARHRLAPSSRSPSLSTGVAR